MFIYWYFFLFFEFSQTRKAKTREKSVVDTVYILQNKFAEWLRHNFSDQILIHLISNTQSACCHKTVHNVLVWVTKYILLGVFLMIKREGSVQENTKVVSISKYILDYFELYLIGC